MQIAIASGKGGTGKTIIATNLAYLLSRNGKRIAYLDCDVEEPNAHLFFDIEECNREDVTIPVPKVDMEACNLCRKCSDLCEYGAIITVGKKVLTFQELCHGCGGCSLVCPQEAISELPHKVGEIIHLSFQENPNLTITYGLLDVGEAMAVPVIREVKRQPISADLVIIDSPPGASCPVIESVKESDFVVLVTEPTPFGLNDLELAVGMLKKLGLPFGILINQVGLGDDRVHRYCAKEKIPILLEIPYSREIAELYSRGTVFLAELPEYEQMFQKLYHSIEEMAA
ncbi:ATP-binding protein [Candidatus Neomarinimicrobiota bacterium]